MSKMIDGIFLTDFNAGSPELHQRALGAYHMASVLRLRNLNILVIDFIHSFDSDEIQKLVNLYVSPNTKFVGISTTFMYNRLQTLDFDKFYLSKDPIALFIKKSLEKNPNLEVFQGGGFHFQKHPLAEHWMPGQYVEKVFIEKLNERFNLRLENDYEFTEHQFSFLPQDFLISKETLPVEVSRGCVFSCKFCAFSGRGKKVNTNIKNYSLVQQFLEQSFHENSTTNFYIADDTFNESLEKLRFFSQAVQHLDFKPKFCAYVRIDLLIRYPEMIDLLYQMGVRGIAFGIETFHPKAAFAIGKNAPADKIKALLAKIKSSYPDIYLSSGFIVGLPFEPIESVEETNQWLLSNRVLDSWHFAPLILDNKLLNPNPSYFSQKIEQYDYSRDGDYGWVRNDLDFNRAETFCRSINSAKESDIGPSPWTLFSFLDRHNWEDLRSIKIRDLPGLNNTDKLLKYKKLALQG